MSILWWPKSRNDKLCDGYGVLDVCGSMWGPICYVHNKHHREYDRRNDGNVDIVQALMDALFI